MAEETNNWFSQFDQTPIPIQSNKDISSIESEENKDTSLIESEESKQIETEKSVPVIKTTDTIEEEKLVFLNLKNLIQLSFLRQKKQNL